MKKRYGDGTKYVGIASSEQWNGMSQSGGMYSSSGAPTIWRQLRNSKSNGAQFYATEETFVYTDNWREHENDTGVGGAVATTHGTISLRLHNRIRVDMTVDRAVRVINFKVCCHPFRHYETN